MNSDRLRPRPVRASTAVSSSRERVIDVLTFIPPNIFSLGRPGRESEAGTRRDLGAAPREISSPTSSGELPAAGCWSLPAGGSRGLWRLRAPGADSPRSPWVLPAAEADALYDPVQAKSSRYLLAAILLLKLQELDGTHRTPSDPHAAIHRHGLPGTIILDLVGLLEEQVSFRGV
jgi:hypothetical protein